MNTDNLKWNEQGLIPAIVQDESTKEVLTLAYMNKESLAKTIETKETWFYSRSREELWHKGETSGNKQKVKAIQYDCDKDALLVKVEPVGPACHTGAVSCFHETIWSDETEKVSAEEPSDDSNFLLQLEKVIAEREQQRPEGSYTTYLFEQGVDKILKKVGEESAEVIIAAKNRDHDELKWEVSDLFYHVLVLLREQGLPYSQIEEVLRERHAKKEEDSRG